MAVRRSQIGQIFFTASLLVSGVQIPLAPFEQVVTPAPGPTVPQQVGPPTFLPGFSGRTVQVAGGQNLPPGGSGGDAIIGGANPASPLYAGDVQDELWTAFGKREANNWLNEGPEQEFMQQLNDLGNMNLLNAGGGNRGTLQIPRCPQVAVRTEVAAAPRMLRRTSTTVCLISMTMRSTTWSVQAKMKR